MRDAEILYLFVIGLFLYECIITVPIGSVVMQQRFLRWRRVEPFVLRSGAGPAIVLAWPLPPLGLLAIGRRHAERGRMALAEVAPRLATYGAQTLALRLCESVLWLATFVGGAALVWLDAIPSEPILGLIAASWVATAVAGVMVQRRLAKPLRAEWKDVIVALLSPLSALRLHDVLGKKVVADLDELALIGALARPVDRVVPFRVALARATHLGHGDAAAVAALAVEAGLDPTALSTMPERESLDALAYCPVCHAQFLRLDATCEACDQLRPTPY